MNYNKPLPQPAISHLDEVFDETIVDQFLVAPEPVDLPYYAPEYVPDLAKGQPAVAYAKDEHPVRTSLGYYEVKAEDENAPTVMYIPGLLEQAGNKVSTAAMLAEAGVNCILPEQDRGPLLINPATNKPDATYTQARNMLEVMKHQYEKQNVGRDEDDRKPLHLAPHSIGALVTEEMIRIAEQSGLDYLFKDAQVYLLAPAGLRKREHIGRIAAGYVGMMLSEMDNSRFMTYPDINGLTGQLSVANLKENPGRALAEVKDLLRRKVDLNYIARHVDSVVVLPYGHDKMFPGKGFEHAIQTSSEPNILWASPVYNANGVFRGRDGATHDDEQFTERPAMAIAEFMRQREAVKAGRPYVHPDPNSVAA